MSKSTTTPTMALGTFQIYKKALNIPNKNLKLMLHVFIIYVIVCILLATSNQFSVYPFIIDMITKYVEMQQTDPTDPIYYNLYGLLMKDVKEFAIIEVIFFVISFIINTIVRIMVFYALALTYVESSITLKELLCKVKGNLKGPIVTQLLVSLLNFGCFVLLLVFMSLPWFFGKDSLLFLALVSLLSISAAIWFLYLSTWWVLTCIVSVIEEGCFGVSALKRASHLIKGKKWKGVSIFLVYLLLSVVISVVYGLIFGGFIQNNLWKQLLTEWIQTSVMGVLSLLFSAAMIVYYYECSKGIENESSLVKGNLAYKSLSTVDVETNM